MRMSTINSYLSAFLLFVLIVFHNAGYAVENNTVNTVAPICPMDQVVKVDGKHQLALVIGVGTYKNPRVPPLPGASADAQRMYDYLISEQGPAFPASNVCLLINENANKRNVIDAFSALTDRADKGDTVVFYYAGHGSQVKDTNDDESDGMDETFLVYDARAEDSSGRRVSDLRDDEFNDMLSALHKKTKNITVILDSCNSGTATRNVSEDTKTRFFEPDTSAQAQAEGTNGAGDGARWAPEDLDGVIMMAGAVDGTPALEKAGKGIFTDALITVLSRPSTSMPTYRQLARQATPLVRASSYQVIQFHGDLDRPFLGAKKPNTVSGWEVAGIGPEIKIAGAPISGMGVGAKLRIYPSGSTADVVLDPQKSKATIEVKQTDGITATTAVVSSPTNAEQIVLGDLVVMALPAVTKLGVRIRPANEEGGLSVDRENRLQSDLAANGAANNLVDFSGGSGFELVAGNDGKLQLWGPENKVRKVFGKDSRVIENLVLHAKQRALLQLNSQGGEDYKENQTLKARIIPFHNQDACSRKTPWVQAEDNSTQVIPLCYKWNLQVTVSPESPKPLLIGGLILTADGSIYGFPADGRKELVKPGDTITFNSRNETYRAVPPLDQEEQILVFGTDNNNPVDWHTLTSISRAVPSSSLGKSLNQYMSPGATRGLSVSEESNDDTQTWTRSTMAFRVEANSRFAEDSSKESLENTREYTIPNFDVRPYLPDDANNPLHRLLMQANALTKVSATDGYPYKQHAWSQGSDAANLKLGIDCSRAIWYAFTRAGLPYNNSGNAYLTTAKMVTSDSLMQDQFEACPANESFRTGDVLVYRDDTRGDGHTVVVIDAEKRIAWGSHGWDGNSRILPVEPDTGVEYQKIKIKKDWNKWDRGTMTLRKCWRYKGFNKRALLGQKALTNTCGPNWCEQ